ncbi:Coatomer subunit gamma (CopG) [Paratrimastix pyriformis]|uniref:Coatomer subunit gamma n=1 Tax=Paratrimastix pyriformis TaxID=342808 RepID=A0ABQ8UPY7_9EUKA|nr:Coatomer subunit gamma (CopG) [Paratrimastix pyriformis]
MSTDISHETDCPHGLIIESNHNGRKREFGNERIWVRVQEQREQKSPADVFRTPSIYTIRAPSLPMQQSPAQQQQSGGLQQASGERVKEEDGVIPSTGIDRSTTVQAARLFHDATPRTSKVKKILIQILYLISNGENLTSKESEGIFFGVTKLFFNKDLNLHRLVYLAIKELKPAATDVIIVTSSLTKDMTHKYPFFRANALRVLSQVVDESLFQQVERYFKSSIVDKENEVCSAGLVGALKLMRVSPEPVKRWVSEIQECLKRSNTMCQYHAIALLREIKKGDRLALSKMLTSLVRGWIPSYLAQCMFIRYIGEVLHMHTHQSDPDVEAALWKALEAGLSNINERVQYETARVVVSLPDKTRVLQAVEVLKTLLRSASSATRFGAIRTLCKAASVHPVEVSTANVQLEMAVGDTNRSVATFAAITLLKTGAEFFLDRLMPRFSTLIIDIPDESRVEVVQAMQALCLRMPARVGAVFNFLSTCLRTEGGYDYKKTIVDTYLSIIEKIPTAQTDGLLHLCEFIEDCEYPPLSIRILRLLADAASSHSPISKAADTATRSPSPSPSLSASPSAPHFHQFDPSKHIRTIYNRVILEVESVRASAVTALARMALHYERLRPQILTILKRCQHDPHDEVRDRVAMYLRLLEPATVPASQRFLLEDLPAMVARAKAMAAALEPAVPSPAKPAGAAAKPAERPAEGTVQRGLYRPSVVGLVAVGVLCSGVAAFLPSCFLSPVAIGSSSLPAALLSASWAPSLEAAEDGPAEPAFYSSMGLGTLFKRTEEAPLTEPDTEYVVRCTKHIFDTHVLFQFSVRNTLPGQQLRNVTVQTAPVPGSAAADLTPDKVGILKSLEPLKTADALVSFNMRPGSFPLVVFSNLLKFEVHEVDTASGHVQEEGWQDDYQLMALELSILDFVRPVPSWPTDFGTIWTRLEPFARKSKFALREMRQVAEAFRKVRTHLSMTADLADAPAASCTRLETRLAGQMADMRPILAHALFTVEEGTVTMQLEIRSPDAAISDLVLAAL